MSDAIQGDVQHVELDDRVVLPREGVRPRVAEDREPDPSTLAVYELVVDDVDSTPLLRAQRGAFEAALAPESSADQRTGLGCEPTPQPSAAPPTP